MQAAKSTEEDKKVIGGNLNRPIPDVINFSVYFQK